MEEILTAALGQGLYAELFVFLLLWVLRKNEEREKSYHRILKEQAQLLQKIAQSVEQMKGQLDRLEAPVPERDCWQGRRGNHEQPVS